MFSRQLPILAGIEQDPWSRRLRHVHSLVKEFVSKFCLITKVRQHEIGLQTALWLWEDAGNSAGFAGDKSLLPPQGTLYWSGVRVWEDGTHDIIVPAVRDAIGCGDDSNSALADAREKLAVRVQSSVKEGLPVRVLGKKETALSLRDDMSVVAQQCKVLGMAVPILRRTELRQIDLDYGLVCK